MISARVVLRWLGGILLVGASVGAGCRMGAMPWHRKPKVDPHRIRIDARAALFQSTSSENPVTRAHAIEALGEILGPAAGGVYLQGLRDKNSTVRFTAAMVVGDLAYAGAKQRLSQMAADKEVEPDRRVYCAVLYALHRLGQTGRTSELGRLLFDPQQEVRAHAAMAMGKIGEPSAIGPMKTLLGDEVNLKVRWQIYESLAMLGDAASLQSLEAFARYPDLQLQLAAIQAMGRTRVESAPTVLRQLLGKRNRPQIRLAAAGVLAKLGEIDPGGYKLCVAAARDPGRVLAAGGKEPAAIEAPQVSQVRQLAGRALGWMGGTESLGALAALLSDQDGSVRVAAALGVLRLLGAPQAPGEGKTPPASGPSPAAAGGPRGRRGGMYTAGGED